MSIEKLKLYHEEMLQEEGIKISELPTELQSKIKGFNLMKKKLEKSPDDERLFIQLQKTSTKLGDAIQNFIESDYDSEQDDDDDDDDDSKENKSDSDSKENKSDSKENKSDSDSKENKSDSKENKTDSKKEESSDEKPARTKTPSGKFGNLMMEKKILAIMDARGEKRIKISDLESIIGKEPNYPEQEVNNIKLRKVFLSNDYRLI
jgi:cobalamin biosynthesis protein CobT